MKRASLVTTGSALLVLSLGVAAAVAGCGISTEAEDLFGSATGAGGSTSQSSASTTTSNGQGGDPSTTSVGPTTSVTTVTGMTTSVTNGPTTSVTTTSTGSNQGGLACGDGECPLGGDSACCWDAYQLNAPPQAECVNAPPDQDGCDTSMQGIETRIECQSPADCPAQVCCGDRVTFQYNGQNVTYYAALTCEAACAWPDITMCDMVNPNCPTVTINGVPTQTICKTSQLLPVGYFVCGTP